MPGTFNGALFFAWIVAFFFGVAIQKYVQAYVATALGDPTPRKEGRLTLNPTRHHEALGLFMAFIAGLGISMVAWGKPVKTNSFVIRGGRMGTALVALVAPLTNLLLAFLIWIASKAYITSASPGDFLGRFLVGLVVVNLILCAFNFILLPPMEGWTFLKAVLPPQWEEKLFWLDQYGLIVLLVLVFIIPFFLPFNPIYLIIINPIVNVLFQLITGLSI